MQSPEVVNAEPPTSSQRERYLYRPASWFEPLDLPAIFGRRCPLELELGSGDGSFLVRWATQHPDRDFIGVERLLGRIRKLDRKAQRAGISNLRGLRIEAGYAMEYLFPVGSVTALHVYFPDPWPKRRHHKHRLVNERFVTIAHRVLASHGVVHLRTDSAEYFEQMKRVLGESDAFSEVTTPPELVAVATDFEQDFMRAGTPILRASYAVCRPYSEPAAMGDSDQPAPVPAA